MAFWAFVLGFLTHLLFARYVFTNERRDTPLHIACRKGNVKNVKYLIDRGADPNVFNFIRETPLSLACASDNALIVKMLLDHNADANDAVLPVSVVHNHMIVNSSDA